MKEFSELVWLIGNSVRTSEKLDALSAYFNSAPEADSIWVIALFTGRRPRRAVNSRLLGEWCMEQADIPAWLYTESYSAVGDLAETIALLLPPPNGDSAGKQSLSWFMQQLTALHNRDDISRKEFILNCWNELDTKQRFVFNKLITGAFRIGISQQLVVQALSRTVQLPPEVITHRISGRWDPSTTNLTELLDPEHSVSDPSKPYPFYLAYALDMEPGALGEAAQWQAEWKWDGIRGQIIRRNGSLFVWSRGGELITEKFPEFHLLENHLPEGIAIDGEILPWKEGQVMNFNTLQTRIGRKNVTRKHLQEAPAVFFAFDILEWNGNDLREHPLHERRSILESVIQPLREENSNFPVMISPTIEFGDWQFLAEQRKRSREMNSEGLMLKKKESIYQSGRKRGDWWKWKTDPLSIDAVLIYAARGSGRRSGLYTDYTFAVRDGDRLVSFAKAYSGLTDKEIAEVDRFIKNNAVEKFGPVRTVKPELVFEIAFEGIAASSRHKSGVALRFPRIHRWRKDKSVGEINTLDDLKEMLERYGK